MRLLKFPLSILLFLMSFQAYTQGLQPGECGIRFTYDATGSLIKRDYICNNTGVIMYKQANGSGNKTGANSEVTKDDLKEDVLKVNAIMPNPTTGAFKIYLSTPINNATVKLLTVNGSVIEKKLHSGNIINFDISSQPSGNYFVSIEYEGKKFTFKVIKQ